MDHSPPSLVGLKEEDVATANDKGYHPIVFFLYSISCGQVVGMTILDNHQTMYYIDVFPSEMQPTVQDYILAANTLGSFSLGGSNLFPVFSFFS